MNILALFGTSVVNLLVILRSITRITGMDTESPLWTFAVCLLILLVPARCSRNVRQLGRVSRLSVYLMHIVLFIVICFALKNRVWPAAPIKYTAFGSLEGVFIGLAKIAYAVSGLQYLPYIFSDMYKPENAAKVCTKAYRHAFVFFIVIILFGYVGWGDNVSEMDSTSNSLLDTPGVGRVVACFMVIQAFLSYPLTFAPLARTTEHLLRFESAPAVTIAVPWAIRLLRFQKKAVQVGLVFGGFLAKHLLIDWWASTWIVVITVVAGNCTERIFPALFSIVLDHRERSWEGFDTSTGARGLGKARDSLIAAPKKLPITSRKEYRWLISTLSMVIGFALLSWGLLRFTEAVFATSANVSTNSTNTTFK